MTLNAKQSINASFSNLPVSDVWQIRRQKVSSYALYAAVACMPFSIQLCHLALVIFLVLWLFEKNLWEKILSLRHNYQLIALIGFAISLLLGILYSANKNAGWFALEKKLFFFALPIAFATSQVNTPKFLKNLLTTFSWSCFVALVVCFIYAFQRVQLFHAGELSLDSINYLSSSDFWKMQNDMPKEWMFLSYVSLASAIGMHPTYLAMYTAFCCVWLAYEYLIGEKSQLKQAVNVILIIFFSTSIIFLSARIVVILLGVIYIGLFCHQVVQKKRKIFPALALGAFILLLLTGVLVNPITRYRQVDEIALNGFSVSTDKNYTNSTGIRASLWWLSIQTYLDSNILFGVGTGDVEDSVEHKGRQLGITNVLNSYSPHNEYLQILLATGLMGLTFFLIYIGIGLVKAWQNDDIIFLNFMLLFTCVCMTESALELQKGIVFFSIFFSSMTFQNVERKELKNPVKIANVASQLRY